jgi:methionine-rich copper-binding protein CopC
LRRTFLLLAILAAAPAAALDQPVLLHSDPGQGDVTPGPPAAVRLRFNRPMRLDRLQVFDAAGVEQAVRRSRDTAPALEQRGGLMRLPLGEYRAEWAASSPSGQSISGTLTFRVGEAPPD